MLRRLRSTAVVESHCRPGAFHCLICRHLSNSTASLVQFLNLWLMAAEELRSPQAMRPGIFQRLRHVLMFLTLQPILHQKVEAE